MNYRRVGRRRHDRLSKGSPWVCAHGDLTAILSSRKRFGRELRREACFGSLLTYYLVQKAIFSLYDSVYLDVFT
ncbi:hypothetical protein F9L69_01895 [Brucella melitensis]|uniref:Uncharacterized protein n=1 Tax=Brucella melitensis biotype 1 (strain ATCC 23456 / CCUG 17765 / NCTC 10094 / 16M) TaxID=224914 RepID=Q8YH99_BRUME|nr:hypothetical protein BMEI0905 [Brucella melitensis bv. 1 str. 16M]AQQ57349.1 hypothetical protein ADS42_010160 [Brucella melitensis]ARX99283.1 hypothetical protein BK201_05655 [Brucella melitensis]ARY02461.1 hypothetical protein BK186_05660 [Brucella melitensis]ARY05644.1 hypothetical protein BK218_05660 [Brucella melitensis]